MAADRSNHRAVYKAGVLVASKRPATPAAPRAAE